MDIEDLNKLVYRQLGNFFADLSETEIVTIANAIQIAYEKTVNRFSKIINPHYGRFNPYNSDQYASFLYTLSHVLSKQFPNRELADKVFYLNKIMHSLNIYHEVKLPDTFILEHPLATVLGRADYGENFTVFQHCTVGSSRNKNGEMMYPTIGENVIMFVNSSIIGNSKIGDNCIIAQHCQIQNEDVPNNSIVFGSSPNLVIKENKKNYKFFKEG